MITLKKIKAGPLCENEMPEMPFYKQRMQKFSHATNFPICVWLTHSTSD
jgi:hypothetical protein